MRRKRYSPEQIIKILQEGETTSNNKEICRKYGISEQTFYNWRNKYVAMTVNEIRRLKVLEKTCSSCPFSGVFSSRCARGNTQLTW